MTQTQATEFGPTLMALFAAHPDAVVEWHLLPEPTEPSEDDEWMPEYDDDVDECTEQTHPRLFRLLNAPTVFDTVTQTQGVQTA